MKVQELLESKEYTVEEVNRLLDTYDFTQLSSPLGWLDKALINNFEKVRPYLNCVAILTCYTMQIKLRTTAFDYSVLSKTRTHNVSELSMNEILTFINKRERTPLEMEEVDQFFQLTSNISNIKYLKIPIDPNGLHVRFYAYKANI